eukprot:TRINITY_DN1528_c0_g2_i22.p11 TRINITY_DN1528_c0_g2~~TRINITY_DN1528_c0_g2_i22.p11  ORF type:complete len:132 (+),score=3.24 TRINITY_DN1528_c0_g2_i22:2423-2818(+)
MGGSRIWGMGGNFSAKRGNLTWGGGNHILGRGKFLEFIQITIPVQCFVGLSPPFVIYFACLGSFRVISYRKQAALPRKFLNAQKHIFGLGELSPQFPPLNPPLQHFLCNVQNFLSASNKKSIHNIINQLLI